MGSFERLDEDLGWLLNCLHSYWHENNLLYIAYAEPQQLEVDEVRMLFFQVGSAIYQPDAEEIWDLIIKRKDYGRKINIDDIPW